MCLPKISALIYIILSNFTRCINWMLSYAENNDFIKAAKQVLLPLFAVSIGVVPVCDLSELSFRNCIKILYLK